MATLSFGSRQEYHSDRTKGNMSCSLDASTVVAIYIDTNVDVKPYAIVGTISGGTITWGTRKNIVNSASVPVNDMSIAKIDSTSFVISYGINSSNVYCIIGSISGTDITFGSAADTGLTIHTNENTSVAVLDSTHFVVGYQSGANSLRAQIGVFSGTTISSFGTSVQMDNGVGSGKVFSCSICALDSTHFVFSYKAESDNNYGKAIIGVVSEGTVITAGSKYTFEGSNTVDNIAVTPLSSTTFIIAWDRALTTGQSCLATVANGNEISYGSDYQFYASSVGGDTNQMGIGTLDSTNFAIAFAGFSVVGTNASGVLSYTTATDVDATKNSDYGIGVAPLTATTYAVTYCNSTDSKGDAVIGTVVFIFSLTISDPITINESITSVATLGGIDSEIFSTKNRVEIF